MEKVFFNLSGILDRRDDDFAKLRRLQWNHSFTPNSCFTRFCNFDFAKNAACWEGCTQAEL